MLASKATWVHAIFGCRQGLLPDHTWFIIYPDYFAPVIPYEEKAARISGFELGSVPGLLQTEEYARALIRATLYDATDEYV